MLERLRRTRVRLTLTYVGASALLTVLVGWGFWLVFAHVEYATIDQGLVTQARVIAGDLSVDRGQVTFGGDAPLPAETSHGIAVTALLLSASGRILDRSGGGFQPAALRGSTRHLRPAQTPASVTVGDRPYRVLKRDVGGGRATLVLARPIDELVSTLTGTALLLVGIGALLISGATALGYWVAGRALRPVRVMAATARDITEHDLGRRFRLSLPPGDEIGELGATFDAMLGRLETAFDTLRRFTADAAHELRAPLALMRSQLDVTLLRERAPDEYMASNQVLRAEVDRLSRTTEQLLLLARADAGSLQARRITLDLDDFVDEMVARWESLADRNGVELVASHADADATIQGDPDLLRRCLDNLIDNAIRHTPGGGTVTVSVGGDPEWASITVADTGPGVQPALRPTLFARFTRADPARARSSGAGLGLSLCLAIAVAHSGTITLADSRSGARFVLRLPRSGRAAG